MSPILLTILGFFLLLPKAAGLTWTPSNIPQQCSNITVTVSDTAFTYPLKALVVPVGPSPLNYEVRKVMEVDFPTNTTTVSFQVPYPTGSKLVVLVRDGTGYHPGLTGSTLTVSPSNDASCFDATKNAMPLFTFSLSPVNISECRDVRIYWDSASVQGTPSFLYVIPDTGFAPIALGKTDTQAALSTGFTWKPPVPSGSNFTLVGGDNRGMGAGGFINLFVNPGDPTVSGACPTPSQTDQSPNTSANIGAIAGGVVGGIVLLSVIFIFYQLSRKPKRAIIIPDMRPPQPPTPNPGHIPGRYRYGPVSEPIRPPIISVQPQPQMSWHPVVQPAVQPVPPSQALDMIGQPPPYTPHPGPVSSAASNTASSGSWKRQHVQNHDTPWDGWR